MLGREVTNRPAGREVRTRSRAWSERPLSVSRRLAAGLAILAAVVAVAVAIVALVGDLVRALLAALLLLVMVLAGWYAATRFGLVRAASIALTVLSVAGLIGVLLSGSGHGLLLVALLVIVAVSVSASRFAISRDLLTLKRTAVAGVPVGPAARGALIVNPRSGDGKAARTGLVEEAARRGISTVVLEPGSDLGALAEQAILDGADVIGMAGGDGSQALVASVAMQHDVPVVCVPAGTRNHFALDLGLDRDDVIGALDAFSDAVERPVDLAVVGDRVFVNNASLGVYARIVQSPEYRQAKLRTAGSMLPELEGPGAASLGLAFTAPDGREVGTADVIEQSLRGPPTGRIRLPGVGQCRCARCRDTGDPVVGRARPAVGGGSCGKSRAIQRMAGVDNRDLRRTGRSADPCRHRRRSIDARTAPRVPNPAARSPGPRPDPRARLVPGRPGARFAVMDAEGPGSGRRRLSTDLGVRISRHRPVEGSGLRAERVAARGARADVASVAPAMTREASSV
jgi:hypothetical protein